jgi:2-keto-3-deoxy-L-rhamnonate aldolase RhmA
MSMAWGNKVKRQLKEGKVTVGTWITYPDVHFAANIGRVGFDWVVLDLEHSPINMESAAASLVVLNAGPTVPLVRVPRGNVENIKRVLDAGAWGFVAPMVNTREEAEEVIVAAKYPPLGLRSAGAYATFSMGVDPPTYYQRANEEIMVVVQIENVQAIEHVNEILAVPGIDCAFVGPADLSFSLGLKPQLDNEDPSYLEATQAVLDACARRDMPAGTMVLTADAANAAIRRGFRFISLGADRVLLPRFFRQELQRITREIT